MKKIIGVDVDGVLADFNAAFIEFMIQVTGRDLFPPRPFDIPTWSYPAFYGYTPAEETKAWKLIETSPYFWRDLPQYPDTPAAMLYLNAERKTGADVYFVTSRPSLSAKAQTELWLRDAGYDYPTVLISGRKGMCAGALLMDAYIDDRWENAIDVVERTDTTVYLMDRPWNRAYSAEEFGITRTGTVVGFAAPVAKEKTPA